MYRLSCSLETIVWITDGFGKKFIEIGTISTERISRRHECIVDCRKWKDSKTRRRRIFQGNRKSFYRWLMMKWKLRSCWRSRKLSLLTTIPSLSAAYCRINLRKENTLKISMALLSCENTDHHNLSVGVHYCILKVWMRSHVNWSMHHEFVVLDWCRLWENF